MGLTNNITFLLGIFQITYVKCPVPGQITRTQKWSLATDSRVVYKKVEPGIVILAVISAHYDIFPITT